jgi:hypothetical protein
MDPSGSSGGSAGGASDGLDTLRAKLRASLLKREGKAGAGCCRFAAAAFCVASATEAQCTTCDVLIKLGDSRSGVWTRLNEHAKSDWHG